MATGGPGKVGAGRHARAVPRKPDAREPQEPLNPVAVSPVGLEQLQQARVVDWFSREGPADGAGHVEITEAHGIGISVGS